MILASPLLRMTVERYGHRWYVIPGTDPLGQNLTEVQCPACSLGSFPASPCVRDKCSNRDCGARVTDVVRLGS